MDIADLRKVLQQKHLTLAPESGLPRVTTGHAEADSLLHGGLVLGALHEIFPATRHADAAATGFTAGLAIRAAKAKTLFWIRQDYAALEFGELSATGLVEMGIDPARFLLLRAPDAEAALRAALDGLSCGGLGAAVIEIPANPKILDLVAARKLTLAASQKQITVFLLRPSAEPAPSSTETRWHVKSAPSLLHDDWGAPRFDVKLTRNRHGQTGHWIMEWDCDDGRFRKAHSGAVAAAVAGGAYPTPPQRFAAF